MTKARKVLLRTSIVMPVLAAVSTLRDYFSIVRAYWPIAPAAKVFLRTN